MVFFNLENFSIKNFINKILNVDSNLYSKKNYFLNLDLNFNKFLFYLNLNHLKYRQFIGWKEKNIFRKKFSMFRKSGKTFSVKGLFDLKINQIFKSKFKPLLQYAKFSDLVLVNEFKNYIEVFISSPIKKKTCWQNLNITYLSDWISSMFGKNFIFNGFQLRLFPFIFSSDINLLIGAPTGSGKTILIIFSILRLVINSIKLNWSKGKIKGEYIKILYIAPMKALVKEVVKNFSHIFIDIGLKVYEITGDVVVKLRELEVKHILVGTPEKIQNLMWGEKSRNPFEKIHLFVIDEIHILREERGAILERLLLCFTKNIQKKPKDLRLIALSATIPNFYDLAKFLNINISSGVFYFGPFIRENFLNYMIIGVKSKNHNHFDKKMLNSILIQKLLFLVNTFKTPRIIIFVQSRKDTIETGLYLQKIFEEKQIFLNSKPNKFEEKKLQKIPLCLRKLLTIGIGVHHSGLTKKEKMFIEKNFKANVLKILIATNTLAWGVNLNATHVIIKGTKIYSPIKASWTEISGTNIIQMLGRTGRYGSKKKNTSFIITMSNNVKRYVKLIRNQTPVESTFLKRLPDYLNLEIVFRRVKNYSEALNWFGDTFLWLRIQRLIIISMKEFKQKSLEEIQSVIKCFFISQSLIELSSSGLIKIVSRTQLISSTMYGNISAFYDVHYQTFLEIISNLSPTTNLYQLIELISSSNEFLHFNPRKNEESELIKLNDFISIPIRYPSKTKEFKVSVLILSFIENIKVQNNSLLTDRVYICKNALKLSRILFEISSVKRWARTTQTCFDLCLILKNQNWFYQKKLQQYFSTLEDKPHSTRINMKQLSLPQLQNLKICEIKHITKSKQKDLDKIQSDILVPFYDLELSVHPITKSTIKIDINMFFRIYDSKNFQKKHIGIWIFIVDEICDIILYSKYLKLRNLSREKYFNFSILLPVFENPTSPYYLLNFRSDNNLFPGKKYILDLTQIVYPLNYPIENIYSNYHPLSISRLLLGFKGGKSIREYFKSHFVGLNNYFSTHTALFLKTRQSKICGFFEKKNKNFFQEFSVINNFSMKRKLQVLFSYNDIDCMLLKIFQFRKSSNGILGIPIEGILKSFSIESFKFKKKKKIFFLKNLEIFSILNSFNDPFLKQIILIHDYNSTSLNIELEASFELILEWLFSPKNLKKISSFLLSMTKISNFVDILKLIKSKKVFKSCLSRKSQEEKSRDSRIRKTMCFNFNKNQFIIQNPVYNNYFEKKKRLPKKKKIFFCSNFKSSLKTILKTIFISGCFFQSKYDNLLGEKFLNFYVSNSKILTKSQKFFLSLGFGIHDIYLKINRRKLLEELYLIKTFKKFWISISSISKISTEKFFCSIGKIDDSLFFENSIKATIFIFCILSNYCSKILCSFKKYASKKILKNSFDLPSESSWKRFLLEKGNIIFNVERNETNKPKELYTKLNFFILRIIRNPGFYFSLKQKNKKTTFIKIILAVVLKLNKKNILFFEHKKNFLKQLRDFC